MKDNLDLLMPAIKIHLKTKFEHHIVTPVTVRYVAAHFFGCSPALYFIERRPIVNDGTIDVFISYSGMSRVYLVQRCHLAEVSSPFLSLNLVSPSSHSSLIHDPSIKL